MNLSLQNNQPGNKKNPVKLIGTWNGFSFPQIPNHLKNTPLNDLLTGVKTETRQDVTPLDIQKHFLACYRMLMRETRLSHRKIRQLLEFDGQPQDLILMCQQAGLTMGLRGQAKQLERLRSARVNQYWERLKGGALGFSAHQEFGQVKPFNLVLDTWTLFVQYLMTDQPTASDTFDIKGCMVGASTIPTEETQINLQSKIGGKAFDSYVLTGYQTTWLTGFLPADGNGQEATLEADGLSETGYFEISSGDAATFKAKIGDRVIFTGPGLDPAGEKRTISFFPFTTDPPEHFGVSEPLSAIPVTGTVVRKVWHESGLTFQDPTGSTPDIHTRFLIEEDGGYDKGNGTTVANGIYVESAITLRPIPDPVPEE